MKAALQALVVGSGACCLSAEATRSACGALMAIEGGPPADTGGGGPHEQARPQAGGGTRVAGGQGGGTHLMLSYQWDCQVGLERSRSLEL